MLGLPGAALLVLGLYVQLAHGANILAIFSYSFPSPYLLVAPYMKALVDQGHRVTIISSPYHLSNIDGAHHIRVQKLGQLMDGK